MLIASHHSTDPRAVLLLIVLWVVGGITVVVLRGWRRIKDRLRGQALARLAAKIGAQYQPFEDDTRLGGRYDHIDLFREGSERCTQNHLFGKVHGHQVVACDYHYSTGSSRSRQIHRFGVIIIVLPMCMKEVKIRTESLWDRFAAVVGFEGVEFESAEFSKAYHVTARDRKFAYDLLNPRAIEFLLAHRGYSWEIDVDVVALCREVPFAPSEIVPAIRTAAGFIELIPQFVWADCGDKSRERAS